MTARIDTSPEALAHMLALPDRKLGLSTVEWFDVCMTKEAAFARWSREAVPALAAERDAALAREAKLREALVAARAHIKGSAPSWHYATQDALKEIDAALQDAAK